MFLWILPHMIIVGIKWGQEGKKYIAKCKLTGKPYLLKETVDKNRFIRQLMGW